MRRSGGASPACRSRAVAALVAVLLLAACGNGNQSAPAPSSSATVALAITLGPGSKAAPVGQSVTFTVSAIGAPTRYQWRRNGVDIAGATGAAYSKLVDLADDGARFSVLVGNGAAEVTSAEALLTVYAAPPLVASCPALTDTSFALAPAAPVKAAVDVGAVVGGCKGPLRSVQWVQTAGPAVALLSDATPAISFLPASAGTYGFRADFIDTNGVAGSSPLTIQVVDNPDAARVALRVDRAVYRDGNASLRAWPVLPGGDAVQSLTWRQLAGPPVVLDTRDPQRALFTAPAVARDTALVFAVTMRTALGHVATDEAMVLVEARLPAPPQGEYVFQGRALSRVHAYKRTGPYAAVLQRCVYDPSLQWTGAGKNTCSLSTLPFLAQDTADGPPTVAQIMDRVLVSHDWIGAAFEQLIARSDMADVRRLLNGVTAIVIGAQVRPSFYYALTGAIYLDADNFWLTPDERDVIDETPDFRSDFDRDLAYSGVWRYVENAQNVFLFFPADARLARSVDYLVYESAWLLYHELAHAGDFLPPSVRTSLDPSLTAWDNIGPRYGAGQLPSDLLAAQLPLTSVVMRGLAQVKFAGAGADFTQRSYTPQHVGGFFAADRATDEYNYATTREDIAMVFEETMMARNHGLRRDVAITDKITPATNSNTLVVRWGQRGRVGATPIKPRARLALQQIAPWIDPLQADALVAPLDMRAGESWASNLSLPARPGMARVQDLSDARAREADVYLLRRAQHRH